MSALRKLAVCRVEGSFLCTRDFRCSCYSILSSWGK